jgi:hypothetical protein
MTAIVGNLDEARRRHACRTHSRRAIHDGQFFLIVAVFLIVVNMAVIAYNLAYIEWMLRDLKAVILSIKGASATIPADIQHQEYAPTLFRVAPSLGLMV